MQHIEAGRQARRGQGILPLPAFKLPFQYLLTVQVEELQVYLRRVGWRYKHVEFIGKRVGCSAGELAATGAGLAASCRGIAAARLDEAGAGGAAQPLRPWNHILNHEARSGGDDFQGHTCAHALYTKTPDLSLARLYNHGGSSTGGVCIAAEQGYGLVGIGAWQNTLVNRLVILKSPSHAENSVIRTVRNFERHDGAFARIRTILARSRESTIIRRIGCREGLHKDFDDDRGEF